MLVFTRYRPVLVVVATDPDSTANGISNSGWLTSKAGDSERIRGIDVKLCRGGGQLVAHSSERP